jgi:hypothetical protein
LLEALACGETYDALVKRHGKSKSSLNDMAYNACKKLKAVHGRDRQPQAEAD